MKYIDNNEKNEKQCACYQTNIKSEGNKCCCKPEESINYDRQTNQEDNASRCYCQTNQLDCSKSCNSVKKIYIKYSLGLIILFIAFLFVVKDIKGNKSKNTDKYTNYSFTQKNSSVIHTDNNNQNLTIHGAANVTLKTINSIDELNSVASDSTAVFVLLGSNKIETDNEVLSEIEKATQFLSNKGQNVKVFNLAMASKDYSGVLQMYSKPAVLTVVKGRGADVTVNNVNESTLLQSFVKASSVSSCCSRSSSACCD